MFKKVFAIAAVIILSAGLACAAADKNPVVVMETSKGNVTMELFAKESPITVANFLTYVKKGFYNDTIFHRVIREFMIQGGGFTADLHQKDTLAPIRNEATNGLKNNRGTVTMARTSDVDSATAQFFINLVDNDFLNNRNTTSSGYGYAVFGRVVEGMDVVDRIARSKKGFSPGFDDLPLDAVVIKSIRLVK